MRDTSIDLPSSIHHLLYETLMAYGLELDRHGMNGIPRATEWYRLAAMQESLMMHIRVLYEALFVKPSAKDYHVIDLISEDVWSEFLQAQGKEPSRLLTKKDDKNALLPSWSQYSGRVAHLASRRIKGHETSTSDLSSDLTFFLPYVDRYLEFVKTHLLSKGAEPVSTPFEKWYSHVRPNDPHDTKLLGACIDTVARYRKLLW